MGTMHHFVLERINNNNPHVVVLDKIEQNYTCGRGKDNEIVCVSLLVSRRHCIFFRAKDELYVTDLKSSNGLFINGVLQEPFNMVKLHENDIIGIGCPDTDRKDTDMFIYKLRIVQSKALSEKQNLDNLASIVTDATDDTNRGANNDLCSQNKCNSLRRRRVNQQTSDVPRKVPKLEREETNFRPVFPEIDVPGTSCKSSKEDYSNKMEIDDENDIIILEKSSENHEGKLNQPPDNVLSKVVYIENSNRTDLSGHTSNSLSRKHFNEREIQETSTANSNKNFISDSKHKEISSAIHSANEELPSRTDKIEKNMEDTAYTFLHNGYCDIKLEEEIHIVDDNEECFEHVTPPKEVLLISPSKVKVEQVPKTEFSEIDVVDIKDDEDDVFPCSQLFDSGLDISAVKTEIKQEYNLDNNEYNDNDSDVILLSDSEDEDNPWLQRLSRSQIINENSEKENLDVSLTASNIDTSNEANKEQSTESEYKTNADKHDAEKFNEHIERISNGIEDETMEVSESSSINGQEKIEVNARDTASIDMKIEEPKTHFASNKSAEEESDSTVDEVPKTIRQTSSESLTARMEKLSTSLKINYKKNLPQIIDPPQSTTKQKSKVNKPLSVETSPKKPAKLTSKEKKDLQDKRRIEMHSYNKDKKLRKTMHKWADCLPTRKGQPDCLSKETKKLLADNRKEKLKKLAAETKKQTINNDQTVKRVAAKVVAKVSKKSRGDFLIEEQQTDKTVREHIDQPTSSTSKSRRMPQKSKDKNSMSTDMPKVTKKESNQNISKVPTKIAVEKKKENVIKSSIKVTAEDKVSSLNTLVREGHASIVANGKEERATPKKRVSFSSRIVEVREFEIESNNSLKKLVGKDAPIPCDKLQRRRINRTMFEACPKLEKFLLRIFHWNPVWLEEQRAIKSTPPVVKETEIRQMLVQYKSYEEYYSVALPLLLLELWCGITKEFENPEKSSRRPTVICSVVNNSIAKSHIPSTDLYMTTLMVEILVSREDLRKQLHPVYGDLVCFEYVQSEQGKHKFHKVFAYITNMNKTIITPNTRYNRDLNNYVKCPYVLLTYTMITRPLTESIPTNRVHRLRTVTYLRANMRMIQALQYLPLSPLMNLILNPRVEAYKLPPMPQPQKCTLITKEKLNQKQSEAVLRVTEAIVQKEAKLCFIQGPPGTGKSKVIVNIITQVLYGENRYKDNKGSLKILVCAPSNAAVDEIVLRLLAIRQMFQHRFKMVRIGRPEAMHPSVKSISVTELAKREVRRATSQISSTIPSDCMEEEKRCLEAQINALKCELMTSHVITDSYKKRVQMKLSDLTAQYELLKNHARLSEMDPQVLAKFHEQQERAAENRLISMADIITCTLSSCYTNQMESIFGGNRERISVCIVDEATQSCEAETLIPLMLGVNTLVLVGDPNQLPATVLSQQAKKLGLDQSLFSRMQNAFKAQTDNPIIMLDTQYRMAYPIAYWPNLYFYGGKLRNAVETNLALPYKWYNVLNLNTKQNDDKFSNTDEATFIANMLFSMTTISNLGACHSNISVGILTPYNNQRSLLLAKVNERLSSVPELLKKKLIIEVNTVDSFQGQERDVVIMSCVRSHGIGFLSDRQRLCVALTRAKHSLILCGNFYTFLKDPMWNALINDAKSRGVFSHVKADASIEEIRARICK